MTRSSADTLVYMANQIARNCAVQGEERAVQAVADHIRQFWDPRMRSIICGSGVDGLHPLAERAVGLVREGGNPPQVARMAGMPGGSDAG